MSRWEIPRDPAECGDPSGLQSPQAVAPSPSLRHNEDKGRPGNLMSAISWGTCWGDPMNSSALLPLKGMILGRE